MKAITQFRQMYHLRNAPLTILQNLKNIAERSRLEVFFCLSESLGECTLETHKLISTYSKCCSLSHGSQWGHLNLSEHLESIESYEQLLFDF